MFGWKSGGKAAAASRGAGFLSRLRRDTRGNTLAIVGAALVPLAAMIGSGVDMSRAYMAKARMQSACDAAALAGRRIMQADTPIETVETEAERFFYFNFPQSGEGEDATGPYGTAGVDPTVTSPMAGTVRVSAETEIPTTIMSMFGFESLPLNVTCDASLNFVNTDVMLVLDVTGSMAWNASGSQTSGVPVAEQRITSLRLAVMALYEELEPIQEQLEEAGLRLRYGIVPYSSTVNVGHLIRAVNPDFIDYTNDYWTRRATFTRPNFIPTDTPITTNQAGLLTTPGTQRFRTSNTDRAISNTNCGYFGTNRGFSQSGWAYTAIGINDDADIYDPDGPAGPQATAPAAPTGYTRYQFARLTPAWSTNPANRVCDRTVTITQRSYETRFSYDTTISNPDNFARLTLDASAYRDDQPNGDRTTIPIAQDTAPTSNNDDSYAGTTATLIGGNGLTLLQMPDQVSGVGVANVPWSGCIEERQTEPSITTTTTSIPANALDLNINLIPNSDASRWRAFWPQVTWFRSDANNGTALGNGSCPREASRLAIWTEEELQTYVDSLVPVGSTYHDIGMIWGARMISTGGIFADGCETFNNMPCNRHIIFMTDGEMQPATTTYSAYGINSLDGRIGNTGQSNANLKTRHNARFLLACSAAKSMGVSVWVIAFGVGLNPELSACASNENQASASTNQADLIARFRQIGNQIGALRLTQ